MNFGWKARQAGLFRPVDSRSLVLVPEDFLFVAS